MEGTKRPGRQPITAGERVVSLTVSVTIAQREWLLAHGAAKTVRKLVATVMAESPAKLRMEMPSE